MVHLSYILWYYSDHQIFSFYHVPTILQKKNVPTYWLLPIFFLFRLQKEIVIKDHGPWSILFNHGS